MSVMNILRWSLCGLHSFIGLYYSLGPNEKLVARRNTTRSQGLLENWKVWSRMLFGPLKLEAFMAILDWLILRTGTSSTFVVCALFLMLEVWHLAFDAVNNCYILQTLSHYWVFHSSKICMLLYSDKHVWMSVCLLTYWKIEKFDLKCCHLKLFRALKFEAFLAILGSLILRAWTSSTFSVCALSLMLEVWHLAFIVIYSVNNCYILRTLSHYWGFHSAKVCMLLFLLLGPWEDCGVLR